MEGRVLGMERSNNTNVHLKQKNTEEAEANAGVGEVDSDFQLLERPSQ